MFVLTTAATICTILCPPKPAMAANTVAADSRVYNVKITGQFYRKEALELLDLINAEREKVGEEPLIMDGEAVGVSDLRALQSSINFYHMVPTSEGLIGNISSTLSKMEIDGKYITEEELANVENLATTNSTVASKEQVAESLFNTWMGSRGHKETMLHGMSNRVGISIFTTGNDTGVTFYYCSMNTLMYDDPEKETTVDWHHWRDEEFKIEPYTQGNTVTTRTYDLRVRGDCIVLGLISKGESLKKSVRVSQSQPLVAYYEAKRGINQIYSGAGKLNSSCGTWTTTTPNIVSVNQEGVVTGLKAGTGKVRFDLNGDPEKSCEYTITVNPEIKVAAPKNISIKKVGDEKIQISWEKIKKEEGYDYCYGYIVYRSENPDSGFKKIGEMGYYEPFPTYTTEPGKTYYYKVQSMGIDDDCNDVLGECSETIQYTCPIDQKPEIKVAAPKNISIKKVGDEKIQISWKKVEKEEGYDYCYGYIVYRSEKPDSGFKKIGKIGYCESFPTYTTEPGKTYYYKVQSMGIDDDCNDVLGECSETIRYTCPISQKPEIKVAAPKNISIKKVGDKKIQISWKKVKKEKGYDYCYGYVVYRSEKPDSGFKKIGKIGYYKPFPTYTTKPGKTYYYRVQSMGIDDDCNDVLGECSKTIRYTCPISQKKAPSLSAGAKKITVKWSKTGGVDGTRICYYKKWRGRNVSVRYKNVAGANTSSYTLKGLKRGTYYVRVRAFSLVNGKKVYGKYSSAKKIYVK